MDFLKGKKTKPLVFEITDNAESRLDEFCKSLLKATHCIFVTTEKTVLKDNPFLLYASGFLSGRNIPTFVPKGIKTDKGEYKADLVIDATGLRSPLRRQVPKKFG